MMKKVFFATAVAAMFGLVACNNNAATAEETVDTMVETVENVADATIDEVEDLGSEMVEAAEGAVQEVVAE